MRLSRESREWWKKQDGLVGNDEVNAAVVMVALDCGDGDPVEGEDGTAVEGFVMDREEGAAEEVADEPAEEGDGEFMQASVDLKRN